MAASTAKHLLGWCIALEMPDVWVSDTTSDFLNRVIRTLEGALRVDHRFVVANSPWLNGRCERMVHEVVRAFQRNLQEKLWRISSYQTCLIG